MGILDVKVRDIVEVADHARGDDVALVLDGAGLAAITHAQMAVPRIGVVGHEKDVRPFIGQPPPGFGKLAVIADHYADGTAVGFNHIDGIATLDVPAFAFIRGGVQFFLGMHGAVAQENMGHVVNVAIFHARRMAAADDVDRA